MSARIIAVADATAATLRHLRPVAFTNLHAGRLGVAARPGMRRPSWLASDILTSLGCSDSVSGAGRPGDGHLGLTAAWLRAHHITDLYVQFAWDISHPALRGACDLAIQAGLTLWLVGDSPYSENHHDTLRPYNVEEWDEHQFLDHWLSLLGSSPPLSESIAEHDLVDDICGRWPARVPEDDFTTFRAACRDLLTPDQFEAVDTWFRVEHQRAIMALSGLLAYTDTDAREQAVATWLRQRWEDTPSLGHFVTTIRALQVAAFTSGHYIQVDLDQVIGVGGSLPRRALRNDETWQLLCAYPEPYRGATCALAAAGVGINDVAALPIGAYDTAKHTVVDPTTGEHRHLEPGSRRLLLAQLELRGLHNAGPNDPLIADARGKTVPARSLANVVRQARRELGAAVALAPPDRTPLDPSRWYRRWGISIQELT